MTLGLAGSGTSARRAAPHLRMAADSTARAYLAAQREGKGVRIERSEGARFEPFRGATYRDVVETISAQE
jgi:hypothetical protein